MVRLHDRIQAFPPPDSSPRNTQFYPALTVDGIATYLLTSCVVPEIEGVIRFTTARPHFA
jgi:hypothetical protein